MIKNSGHKLEVPQNISKLSQSYHLSVLFYLFIINIVYSNLIFLISSDFEILVESDSNELYQKFLCMSRYKNISHVFWYYYTTRCFSDCYFVAFDVEKTQLNSFGHFVTSSTIDIKWISFLDRRLSFEMLGLTFSAKFE